MEVEDVEVEDAELVVLNELEVERCLPSPLQAGMRIDWKLENETSLTPYESLRIDVLVPGRSASR